MPKYSSKTTGAAKAAAETVNEVTEVTEQTEIVSKKDETVVPEKQAPTADTLNVKMFEEFMQTLDEYKSQIAALKNELNSLKSRDAENATSAKDSRTDRLLDILANKKSDKEVTIVHNRELIGGLTTHLNLTGISIDFRTLGEERVLSWQQFEECVSKYKRWFDKEIILLSQDNADLCGRYNVSCVKRGNNNIISREVLMSISNLQPRELEDYFVSLTQEDKDFVCSYWLGKCYEREAGFYDRYKIEILNRLSGRGVFDNILALMNGDYARELGK